MADTSVGNNSEIFDPTKEKKKKKKKVLDLDSVLLGTTTSSSSGPAQPEDDQSADAGGQQASNDAEQGGDAQHDDILESLENFGSKKKKKKVKKVILDDVVLVEGGDELGVGGVGGGEEEALDFDFSKAKKKKKKAALDELVREEDGVDLVVVEEETQQQPQQQDDVLVLLQNDDDLTLEESSAQTPGLDDEDDSDSLQPLQPAPKTWLSSDRDYTYDELLTRVFEIMRAKNPEMVSGTKQKFVMRPPQVVRIGTKKTSFVNFMEICKMLHRHQKHLLDFLLSELGTSGSIDGNNQLIIKGRFQQKQIENVLRRYIKEYVTCHTCKSPNTLLQKDFRLFFLQCEACGSRCSVASIKHGFQAVTGKRAAMRAKAN